MQNIKQKCVMVCITDQPGCNGLIAAAATIAKQENLPLVAVTVLHSGLVSEYTADRLQTLYNIAGKHSAELLVHFNDSPALTVAVAARQNEAVHLIVGAPKHGSNHFIETIKGILPEIPLSIIDTEKIETMTIPGDPPNTYDKIK